MLKMTLPQSHPVLNIADISGVMSHPLTEPEEGTYTEAEMSELINSEPTLRILCVSAHPDDAESGCGGTLARYTEAGHRVTILYLTRGERGIRGKTNEEAARTRTEEAKEACRILGATAVFGGQTDGETQVTPETTAAFTRLFDEEQPDVVFTQWPLDTHGDHQSAGVLALRAYLAAKKRSRLFFYEVNSGSQTLGFQPTNYVDISTVRDKKKAALFAHKSQDGFGIYIAHHEIMEAYRGREIGAEAAEAFCQMPRDCRSGNLPGL